MTPAEAWKLRRRAALRRALIYAMGWYIANPDDLYSLSQMIKVIRLMARHLGVSMLEIEAMRLRKLESHGGFINRTVWMGNRPPEQGTR